MTKLPHPIAFLADWRHWRDQDRLKHQPNAFRDWQKMLLASLALLVTIFAFSYPADRWLEFQTTIATSTDVASPRIALDPVKLERVAQWVQKRDQSYQRLLESAPAISDPSL